MKRRSIWLHTQKQPCSRLVFPTSVLLWWLPSRARASLLTLAGCLADPLSCYVAISNCLDLLELAEVARPWKNCEPRARQERYGSFLFAPCKIADARLLMLIAYVWWEICPGEVSLAGRHPEPVANASVVWTSGQLFVYIANMHSTCYFFPFVLARALNFVTLLFQLLLVIILFTEPKLRHEVHACCHDWELLFHESCLLGLLLPCELGEGLFSTKDTGKSLLHPTYLVGCKSMLALSFWVQSSSASTSSNNPSFDYL